MKPNEKAIEAGYNACTTVSRSIVIDIITAAYAAQFQSEDYAGLVKFIREFARFEQLKRYGARNPLDDAADALEAVLAERDKLKATSDAHVKGWMHQCDKATAAIKERDALAKERDALLARLAPVEDEARHLTTDEQKVFHSALRRSAKIKKPVEDEELVRIAANTICVFVHASPDNKTEYHGQARNAIAAIRPHIEAAERERCAKAVKTVGKKINVAPHERPEYEDGYLQGVHDAAAAIRSGK